MLKVGYYFAALFRVTFLNRLRENEIFANHLKDKPHTKADLVEMVDMYLIIASDSRLLLLLELRVSVLCL